MHPSPSNSFFDPLSQHSGAGLPEPFSPTIHKEGGWGRSIGGLKPGNKKQVVQQVPAPFTYSLIGRHHLSRLVCPFVRGHGI